MLQGSPDEVNSGNLLLVLDEAPPPALLQNLPHKQPVVSSGNVALVNGEVRGCRCLDKQKVQAVHVIDAFPVIGVPLLENRVLRKFGVLEDLKLKLLFDIQSDLILRHDNSGLRHLQLKLP